MTELEYTQAITSGKPVHIFVIDELAPVPFGLMEQDPEKMAKLMKFRAKVMAQHTCAKFRDVAELSRKVEVSLAS